MSMLSAQCDELRQMAESVGLAMPQAATLMMEAADTIDCLDAENAKLREENQSIGLAAYELGRKSMAGENAKLRELATYALRHIIEFECEEPDLKMFRGKPCEDCADCGSSDCPKCMPRMFDVSGIEVDA